ncbi:MAG: 6-bladed beta-propeller [Niabella sp.]
MIKYCRNIICVIGVLTLNLLHAQEVPKIRIDPAAASEGPVSNYFDSVEYIPLETSPKSLFGDVDKLIVTDSSVVVFNFDTYSVLF